LRRYLCALALIAVIVAAISGCSSKPEQPAANQPATTGSPSQVGVTGPKPPDIAKVGMPKVTDEEKAFFLAVTKNQDVEVTAMLKKNKKLVGSLNAVGYTPLMVASTTGHPKIVTILLDNGADIKAQTVMGRTALHMAAGQNRMDVVKVLLARGADVNARNKNLGTPLHAAAVGQHPEMVTYLLDHGASINATTKKGITPVIVALAKGYKDVAKILIDKGARIDEKRLAEAKAKKQEGPDSRPGDDFCCENL
jgi:ankyrin repeat protein